MNHAIALFILLLPLQLVIINARFIYYCPECSADTTTKDVTVNVPESLDLSNNRKVFEIPMESDPSQPKSIASEVANKFKTQQYYRDVPIFDATLIIQETSDNQQIPLHGNWYNTSDIEPWVRRTKPRLTSDEALQIILTALDITTDNIRSNISSELSVYHTKRRPYLSYVIEFGYYDASKPNIANDSDVFQLMAIVKAQGPKHKILEMYNTPRTMMACGAAGNQKVGWSRYCSSNKEGTWVRDVASKWIPRLDRWDFAVYDKKHKKWYENGGEKFKCARFGKNNQCDVNVYDNAINGGWGTAIDAFHHAKNAWNMYEKWFGQKPITWPKPFPIYVHVGWGWDNAHFTGDRIDIGDGGRYFHPFSTVDIMAHEIAHGFTNRFSKLVYSGESGGMDEAYSDIVGLCAGAYLRGWPRWRIGYEATKSKNGVPHDALRYLWNPPLDGVSVSHYCNYRSGMDVHYSSGIYNKAVHNLASSGIRKWSMKEIFNVFTAANKNYWTRQSSMRQGLCGLISALYDRYGWRTDVNAMNNALKDAFGKVGLYCWWNPKC